MITVLSLNNGDIGIALNHPESGFAQGRIPWQGAWYGAMGITKPIGASRNGLRHDRT